MCVKFYFSRVIRTQKNFQLFVKFSLKISFFANFFFVSFYSIKTTDIFIPSIKFSLNYHQQNFIHAFLKKLQSNIYLNKNLSKKGIFKNHSNCYLIQLNTLYRYDYFWILEFQENLVSRLTWFDSRVINHEFITTSPSLIPSLKFTWLMDTLLFQSIIF